MFLESAETDWLGTRNIFYNTRTNKISDNINELIDFNHFEFHPEGLNNYLEYGYSVFGQTPISEIKYLEPNSKIDRLNDGIVISKKTDPFEKDLGKHSSVTDTLEYMQYIINNRIDSVDGNIIIPTSGGFDSRIINCLVNDKRRIRAYTYGISKNQSESYEVVYAKKLCEKLGISWNQIELGEFHSWINEWDKMFGISTHAHGMYQMEFYKKLMKYEKKEELVISGIFGDIWSGNWRIEEICNEESIKLLGKNHGLCADRTHCKVKCSNDLRRDFYQKNKEKLKDENWRVILAGRMKIILISYLLRVPENEGLDVWSPFLDYDLVIRMINLDWSEKERRRWQIEYFRNRDVLLGEMNLPCDKGNCLDLMANKSVKLRPLDTRLLEPYFDKEYVETINRNIANMNSVQQLGWYNAYLTLYPINSLLKKLDF